MADAGKKTVSVSWLVPGKEPELIESFQSVLETLPASWRKTTAPAACGEARNRGGKRNPVRDRKRAYDYRRFLKRFTVTREEMELISTV